MPNDDLQIGLQDILLHYLHLLFNDLSVTKCENAINHQHLE